MPKFSKALHAWASPLFNKILKQEIIDLDAGILPLAQATTQAGFVDETDIDCTIIKSSENKQSIMIHVAVFFSETVINCGCGDEPMTINAYAEIRLILDKQTATVTFEPISS